MLNTTTNIQHIIVDNKKTWVVWGLGGKRNTVIIGRWYDNHILEKNNRINNLLEKKNNLLESVRVKQDCHIQVQSKKQ